MKKAYLTESELEWSPIVANNSMNRKRVAFGVNSYERELKFNPIEFLLNRQHQQAINWADLCCGEGNALIQASQHLQSLPIGGKVSLVGIDLVDFFSDSSHAQNMQLIQQNLKDWQPHQAFDLITIVHGLHYIGDKLGLIFKSIAALKPNGVFIGNLDLNNIVIEGKTNIQSVLKKKFKDNNIEYNSRTKLIKAIGGRKIDHKWAFLGAKDDIGANYTGQNSVNSIYKLEV